MVQIPLPRGTDDGQMPVRCAGRGEGGAGGMLRLRADRCIIVIGTEITLSTSELILGFW